MPFGASPDAIRRNSFESLHARVTWHNAALRHIAGVLALLAMVLISCGLPPDAKAESLLDKIKSSGILRIGVEGTYPPFNFQDASGKLAGFEIDFGRAVAAQLGAKAEFVPSKWDGMLAALEAGRLDVVINQVEITEERKKKFDFSQPYTISGIQIIVRRGDEGKISKPADLAGRPVGVGLGSNYEQWLRKNVPQADVRTYDDDPTKYQDLRSGRIDAVLNDRLVVAEFIRKSGGPFVGSGEPFARQEAGIALRKDPDLVAALNKAIDALRASGELRAISEKWFGTDVTT
jgi:L-cystine transport system substrate-binding protein